jgi:hypothetical protein
MYQLMMLVPARLLVSAAMSTYKMYPNIHRHFQHTCQKNIRVVWALHSLQEVALPSTSCNFQQQFFQTQRLRCAAAGAQY